VSLLRGYYALDSSKPTWWTRPAQYGGLPSASLRRGQKTQTVRYIYSLFKATINPVSRTIFLFHENSRPVLCPITNFLARAIRDDAVLEDGYSTAEPFFQTDLGDCRAMRVHWKPSMLKVPVFRNHGGGINNQDKPLPYSTYAFYLNRLGKYTGFEQKLTSYCLRRGLSNAING
jgi:hypothetical protein